MRNQHLKWLGVFIENEENQVQDYNDFVEQPYQYCGSPSIQAHNLSLDPFFVDPSLSDTHLLIDSPVINRGDGSIVPLTNFDGTLHAHYYNVDIGAYELFYLMAFMPNVLRVPQGDISPTGLR
jgi:hypothetical protein